MKADEVPLQTSLADLRSRLATLSVHLGYDDKKSRLAAIEAEFNDPATWQDREKSQVLAKERSVLQLTVKALDTMDTELADALDLSMLADSDDDLLADLDADARRLEEQLSRLEWQQMFGGEMDSANAFVEIKSGAGGTEAQDWADMLFRMYLRWGRSREFDVQVMTSSPGDVAGIRGVMIRFAGPYAYGWLRTEQGIHRLVRNSPFNAENKRHTSFASVFVSPEVDDQIVIDLDMSEVRIDTYRASGAGGQHVNKTDSAVRLTHLPTGTVVQCQNERSQHKNKDWAIRLLKSKLYEIEEEKRRAERQAIEESKKDIGWSSQIRSYVLDQSRVKDHRTKVEVSNPEAVLNGDIDLFLEANLKAGL